MWTLLDMLFVLVAGLVRGGHAALLLDQSGVGRHDHDGQLQLIQPQLLAVRTLAFLLVLII